MRDGAHCPERDDFREVKDSCARRLHVKSARMVSSSILTWIPDNQRRGVQWSSRGSGECRRGIRPVWHLKTDLQLQRWRSVDDGLEGELPSDLRVAKKPEIPQIWHHDVVQKSPEPLHWEEAQNKMPRATFQWIASLQQSDDGGGGRDILAPWGGGGVLDRLGDEGFNWPNLRLIKDVVRRKERSLRRRRSLTQLESPLPARALACRPQDWQLIYSLCHSRSPPFASRCTPPPPRAASDPILDPERLAACTKNTVRFEHTSGCARPTYRGREYVPHLAHAAAPSQRLESRMRSAAPIARGALPSPVLVLANLPLTQLTRAPGSTHAPTLPMYSSGVNNGLGGMTTLVGVGLGKSSANGQKCYPNTLGASAKASSSSITQWAQRRPPRVVRGGLPRARLIIKLETQFGNLKFGASNEYFDFGCAIRCKETHRDRLHQAENDAIMASDGTRSKSATRINSVGLA
ncbi:hypothetical protein DFH09DRAFT_1100601 [Mycena vulgaris]|nr:hypothetical protein DFH09DRAFT_1100601 [Mycena vulgaris]